MPQELNSHEERRYLTLSEAGDSIRKTGRWVERHLRMHSGLGAPAIIVLPSAGRSQRAAGKLIERDQWERWLRTLAASETSQRTTPEPARPHSSVGVIPEELQPPSVRRRIGRGF